MKITPDSSLFSALSNLPGAADTRRRTPADGQAAFTEAVNKKVGNPGQSEKDARDAIVRQALREAAQRQASLRNTQATASSAATTSASPASVFSAESPAASGIVKREAPFADSRPGFVRLGQFIDIQV